MKAMSARKARKELRAGMNQFENMIESMVEKHMGEFGLSIMAEYCTHYPFIIILTFS